MKEGLCLNLCLNDQYGLRAPMVSKSSVTLKDIYAPLPPLIVLIRVIHDHGKKCMKVMEKYKVSVHSQNSAFLGHSNSSFSRGGC